MGIVRYPVGCPGCGTAILLRLAVAHDERQPFFYVCPVCHAATRGALLWSGGAETSLELADGEVLDSDDAIDHVISINPDFPSIPTAKSLKEPEGSAFLMFASLLGMERLVGFQALTGKVKALVENDWNKLQRLTTYYLNRNWRHFDQSVKAFLPETEFDSTQEWYRDHVVHYLYDTLLILLVSLDEQPFYPNMKASWNLLWSHDRPNFPNMVTFAKNESATLYFREVQRDLFGHVARYVELLPALLPGLLCNMLPPQHQGKVDTQLRLFRDDYELLRDLYIQTFETCHKALRWVVGAANVDATGDADDFSTNPSSQSIKGMPKSLEAFDKLTSANKRRWLPATIGWTSTWDTLFERRMRNDLGHASAHHELKTGLILRQGGSPTAYTRFVACVERLVHGLLATLGVLKIVRIYSFASPSEGTSGSS